MGRQLELIKRSDVEWRLDNKTREVGRRGIAEARRALEGKGNRGHRPPSRPRAA